jgi:hypothetical protein
MAIARDYFSVPEAGFSGVNGKTFLRRVVKRLSTHRLSMVPAMPTMVIVSPKVMLSFIAVLATGGGSGKQSF